MTRTATVAGVREQRAGTGYVVSGLLVAAIAQLAAVEALRRVFVDSVRGQWLDAAALAGHTIGERQVEGLVDTVLEAVTVLSVLAAIVAIGFIALIRGRVLLAVAATLLIVGANVTTQLLKFLIERPELGIDLARAGAGNSLPSGHTTVAASVAVALVLVLPPAVRGVAAVLGAGYAAFTGAATVSAAWHRPSDAVAALLVVGAWAALAGALLAIGQRNVAGPRRTHRYALTILLVAGVGFLLLTAVAMASTYQALDQQPDPDLLGRARLLVAYAGGAVGIASMAALVMALVVATVPRVVPERLDSSALPG